MSPKAPPEDVPFARAEVGEAVALVPDEVMMVYCWLKLLLLLFITVITVPTVRAAYVPEKFKVAILLFIVMFVKLY